MKTTLRMNQQVTVETTLYRVIGIDTYALTNVFGKPKKWISYTLINDKNNKIWISYGAIPKYFVQWTLVPESEFKKEITTPLNCDLSGIANITFEGNPGFSTPIAELFWFNLKGNAYDFYVVEKFITEKGDQVILLETYFDGGKILKNFNS